MFISFYLFIFLGNMNPYATLTKPSYISLDVVSGKVTAEEMNGLYSGQTTTLHYNEVYGDHKPDIIQAPCPLPDQAY